jgi:hypothetical protein
VPPLTLFGVDEARHYCGTFKVSGGAAGGSLDAYVKAAFTATKILREGTAEFDQYRDCSLRDVERRLFMAVSHYRRSLDLMTPGAAWWAHVTLYYGSFFAASALLGMFGARVIKSARIEVKSSAPGAQELAVLPGSGSTYSGVHQRFWDLFYSSVLALVPLVEPAMRIGLTPVTNSATWLSERRNLINYDPHSAIDIAGQFQTGFDKRQFPVSLPGAVGTQFTVFETLLLVAMDFARDFGLATDALHALNPTGTRRLKLRRLVFEDRAPGLVRRIRRTRVLV